MSDSTHRDRGAPPATSKKPITLEVHLEPKGDNDWSLTVTSSVGTKNSARLLHSVADMMPHLNGEQVERVQRDDDMKVVILQKMEFRFPVFINGAVKIDATVTPLEGGVVEVCLKSNAPAEETKRILSTLHPQAMEHLP